MANDRFCTKMCTRYIPLDVNELCPHPRRTGPPLQMHKKMAPRGPDPPFWQYWKNPTYFPKRNLKNDDFGVRKRGLPRTRGERAPPHGAKRWGRKPDFASTGAPPIAFGYFRIFAGPDRPYETPESPRTELNEDISFNWGFLAPKKPCRNRDFFPQSRY